MERAIKSLEDVRESIGIDHPHRFDVDSIIEDARRRLGYLPRESEVHVERVEIPAEAKEELKSRGMMVLDISGRSIAALRESGHPIYRAEDGRRFPKFESSVPPRMEVAVSPQLFLNGSKNKNLWEQKEMVMKASDELGIQGGKLIIAQAKTYIDLNYTYYEATGNPLFDFSDIHTSTKTLSADPWYSELSDVQDRYGVTVGRFDPKWGIRISKKDMFKGQEDVGVIPLWVPDIPRITSNWDKFHIDHSPVFVNLAA